MILEERKKIKHLAQTIAIGFIGSFVAFVISLFFPPDFSTDPPKYSQGGLIFGEISVALFIFGCTLLGLKLTEEKKTLPAGGFTMMAIAQGVLFIIYFINTESTKSLEEGIKIYCGMAYLLIPAMILIAFYSEFPKWVNMLGLAACIPIIIVYVMFLFSGKYSQTLDGLSFISTILFSITSLIWGIFTLKNMKTELKNFGTSEQS
jgi:hypothetical protein